MRRWRNFILIGLIFLVVCGMGATLVSAAQGSLPGDRIYGLKLALERARIALASDDISRARIHLECLDIRLDELDRTMGSAQAALALKEVDRALVEATRAVAGLPDTAQGDMRAQLALLALRAADLLGRWQASGGNNPLLEPALAKARALAEVAADPNASSGDLLRALQRLLALDAPSGAVEIAAHGIPLPASLLAAHQPPFSGRHAAQSVKPAWLKTAGFQAFVLWQLPHWPG